MSFESIVVKQEVTDIAESLHENVKKEVVVKLIDRVEWTIKFLEEYHRYPCLWKKDSPDFKNRTKRDNAEQQLLPLSGFKNVKELRSKIRSIRCTYNQEVTKIKKSIANGAGKSDVYTPKLGWFALADSFLRQNFIENESESNLNVPTNFLEINMGNPESIMEIEAPLLEPISPQMTTVLNSRKRLLISHRPNKQKNKRADDSLNNAVEVRKEITIQPSHATMDEFTAFGQHVASQLQCLPLEEALKLQEDIQKLITTARLRCIRAKQSPSSDSCVITTTTN